MEFRVNPSSRLRGELTVPGDKSISHRALLLSAIADGTSTISGFLNGADCMATVAALRELGVAVELTGETTVQVQGVGGSGLQAPRSTLDMGNSGTAMRLLAGLLAGQPFTSTLAGDASLSRRPMQRVIEPLSAMGASIDSNAGCPPLVIDGSSKLRGIDYEMPVASAQVKSAVLIAGLYADGETRIHEPATTRDHTERMLRSMGVDVESSAGVVRLQGGQQLVAADVQVPADLSSAAFAILAGLIVPDSDLVLHNVGINPSRTGVIDALREMNADIALENERLAGAEAVADLRVRSSELRGIVVNPRLVSLAIDEFPVLFVAAAAATGKTVFSEIGELRVKESDRIAAMVAGLGSLGIEVTETPDGAEVIGGQPGGGVVDSHGDHRIAMALAVAGTIASAPVTIRDTSNVDTSFPRFVECAQSIGIDISQRQEVSS